MFLATLFGLGLSLSPGPLTIVSKAHPVAMIIAFCRVNDEKRDQSFMGHEAGLAWQKPEGEVKSPIGAWADHSNDKQVESSEFFLGCAGLLQNPREDLFVAATPVVLGWSKEELA